MNNAANAKALMMLAEKSEELIEKGQKEMKVL